jgi:hypothetical protein
MSNLYSIAICVLQVRRSLEQGFVIQADRQLAELEKYIGEQQKKDKTNAP